MRQRACVVAAALVLLTGYAAQSASAAPNGRAEAALPPPTNLLHQVSAADRHRWLEAVAIANHSRAVRSQRKRYPGLRSTTFAFPARCCVDLWYATNGHNRAFVRVDLRRRKVLQQWTGWQSDWQMARGYPGLFGRVWNSPWLLIPLGLLFLLPFVDWRRPFRLLHLDLLMLLAFGISHVFFNRTKIGWSVPLVYPVLLYLLIRMLVVGFRRRPAPTRQRLIPLFPAKWLLAGAVVLMCGRIVLNIVDSNVLDVGYAGVIGAHHIEHGSQLYDGHFAIDPSNGDTYGPVMYLAYVPFEHVIGWSGKWDDVPAAHAAAITWDLLTFLGLFLLGRRLRRGREGTWLGGALAFAWAAYPYSLFVLSNNTNDAFVSMIVVFALLALSAAPVRGLLIGIGAAAKFAPLALAPLFADPNGERRARSQLVFAAAIVLVLVASIVPFLPPGGIHRFYDRTLGFQLGRESPFSVWGQDPSLKWLQTLLKVVAVNLAALLFILPERKTPTQVAALGAAVLIALQLPTVHWFYLYIVWFAPLVLIALFTRYEIGMAPAAPP
jgi:glycosyl transferase family 87